MRRKKRKVTWVGGNWQGQSTCYFKKRAGWAWGELAWGQVRPTVNDKKGIKAGSVQVELRLTVLWGGWEAANSTHTHTHTENHSECGKVGKINSVSKFSTLQAVLIKFRNSICWAQNELSVANLHGQVFE